MEQFPTRGSLLKNGKIVRVSPRRAKNETEHTYTYKTREPLQNLAAREFVISRYYKLKKRLPARAHRDTKKHKWGANIHFAIYDQRTESFSQTDWIGISYRKPAQLKNFLADYVELFGLATQTQNRKYAQRQLYNRALRRPQRTYEHFFLTHIQFSILVSEPNERKPKTRKRSNKNERNRKQQTKRVRRKITPDGRDKKILDENRGSVPAQIRSRVQRRAGGPTVGRKISSDGAQGFFGERALRGNLKFDSKNSSNSSKKIRKTIK